MPADYDNSTETGMPVDYVKSEERLNDRKHLITKLRELRQKYIDEGGELLSDDDLSEMLPRADRLPKAERRDDSGAVLIAMFIMAVAGMFAGGCIVWMWMSA